jgi:hypothetical protein
MAANFTTVSDSSNSSTIDNLDSYIEQRLGARHLPLTTIVPISVVYATIFVVGVLGNTSTCLVIMKNKYMQTPTNVYLANLAVSDLLTHLVGEYKAKLSFLFSYFLTKQSAFESWRRLLGRKKEISFSIAKTRAL